MASLTVIAAYDVREDDRRARLAAVLQSMGDRVQKSVFVLLLDESELAELQARSLQIIDADTDSFLIFRQCSSCWNKKVEVGQASTPSESTHWAVF